MIPIQILLHQRVGFICSCLMATQAVFLNTLTEAELLLREWGDKP